MRWFTVNVVAIRAVSPGSSFLSSAVAMADTPVYYTHLTLPTNREV